MLIVAFIICKIPIFLRKKVNKLKVRFKSVGILVTKAP